MSGVWLTLCFALVFGVGGALGGAAAYFYLLWLIARALRGRSNGMSGITMLQPQRFWRRAMSASA